MENIEIKAYHGSGVSIDAFDYQFTEKGNDQLGSGFYFSTKHSEASAYCLAQVNNLPKLGGEDNPTIHHVTLTITNPIMAGAEMPFRHKTIDAFIRSSPVLEEQLNNFWGEVAFEGKEKLTLDAINNYVSNKPVEIIKMLNCLSADFYPGHPKQFFDQVKKTLGYDGVQMDFDEHSHFVAWFPDQIRITEREPHAENTLKTERKHVTP